MEGFEPIYGCWMCANTDAFPPYPVSRFPNFILYFAERPYTKANVCCQAANLHKWKGSEVPIWEAKYAKYGAGNVIIVSQSAQWNRAEIERELDENMTPATKKWGKNSKISENNSIFFQRQIESDVTKSALFHVAGLKRMWYSWQRASQKYQEQVEKNWRTYEQNNRILQMYELQNAQ